MGLLTAMATVPGSKQTRAVAAPPNSGPYKSGMRNGANTPTAIEMLPLTSSRLRAVRAASAPALSRSSAITEGVTACPTEVSRSHNRSAKDVATLYCPTGAGPAIQLRIKASARSQT